LNRRRSHDGTDERRATDGGSAAGVVGARSAAGAEAGRLEVRRGVGGLGHLRLEKLIQASASGKQFSNAELLSLQASMYKYTLELDLTSKVVEKATSGIKDVVKTQV